MSSIVDGEYVAHCVAQDVVYFYRTSTKLFYQDNVEYLHICDKCKDLTIDPQEHVRHFHPTLSKVEVLNPLPSKGSRRRERQMLRANADD